jgi:hypothetical protein
MASSFIARSFPVAENSSTYPETAASMLGATSMAASEEVTAAVVLEAILRAGEAE